MLLTLNHDCLYLICKHLSIFDHISLSHVNECLRSVVESYYTTNNQVKLGTEIWRLGEAHILEFLAAFANIIEPHIKEVGLRAMNIEKFNLLSCLPLRKVTTLEIYTQNSFADSQHYAAFEKYFKSIYPQLKTLMLSLKGENSINWIYAYDFQNVTNLSIRDSFNCGFVITAEMFPKLIRLELDGVRITEQYAWNFQNLKELKIRNIALQQEQLRMIFRSPALRKITIDCDSLINFDGIAECRSLEELIVSSELAQMPLDELSQLRNLRKLKFMGRLFHVPMHSSLIYRTFVLSLSDVAALLQSSKFLNKLKSLECLKLRSRMFLEQLKEEYSSPVLELLKYCHNLRTFELFGSIRYAAFILARAMDVFRNLYEKRKEPLLIVCHVMRNERVKKLEFDFSPDFSYNIIGGMEELQQLSFTPFAEIKFKTQGVLVHEESQLQCDWVIATQ